MTETSEQFRMNDWAADDADAVVTSFASLGDRLRSALPGMEEADGLVRAIEGEILPRLMLAHRKRGGEPRFIEPGRDRITAGDRDAFVALVLNGSADDVGNFVDAMVARGVPLEAVFIDLLSVTARRFGEMWEEDECDFAQVTVGLCRLHEVLRHNSVVGDLVFRNAEAGRRSILLSTACGDQHVFGLLIVAEFFRREGWRVWSEPGTELADLKSLVARQFFDIVGLSVTREATPEAVQAEIGQLRTASVNPALKVMVGGHCFQREPDLVDAVGADGWAQDAASAPLAGKNLLAELSAGC